MTPLRACQEAVFSIGPHLRSGTYGKTQVLGASRFWVPELPRNPLVITLDDALAGLPGSEDFHRSPPEIGDLWDSAGSGESRFRVPELPSKKNDWLERRFSSSLGTRPRGSRSSTLDLVSASGQNKAQLVGATRDFFLS